MDYLGLQMMDKGHEEIKQKINRVSDNNIDRLSTAGKRVSTKIHRALLVLVVAGLK